MKAMKEGFRFLSLMFLALGFLAGGAENARAEFRAGAAISKITPQQGVPLDGTIMQIGPANGVHDELHARCLVLDDGETRLAFAVADCTMISKSVIDRAKREIETQTGISSDHVCVSATHSHSTPRAMAGLVDDDRHREYLEYLATQIADGVRRAAGNLAPAKIGWGAFEEPRYVHNRRWFVREHIWSKMPNPFGELGERVRMSPASEGLEKPAGPVDPAVFVFSVQHAGGRPLAVLANFGLHYIGGIPGGTISADYHGVFASRIGELLGAEGAGPPFVGIMSNGTSGDVNANDVSKPREKFEPFERMTVVGNDLAEQAAEVVRTIEHYSEDITLAAAATDLELAVRKPSAKRIAWSEEMLAPPDHKGKLTRPQIYAREVQFLKDFPETVAIPIQVFRIDNLAIAQIPCEVFAATGLAIKQSEPFRPQVFTIELANGYFGYLPPPEHFDWGGYETWPARSSFLEEQAEVKIREAVAGLMEKLKEQAKSKG